ncbi:MAG: hypothetical protein BWY72_01245 [Bacteroidetes bacterium ADurb.Bin416]|nr:MAG: hypothetical protein BWY72_01245 [Bacteroidetes bacterium ADurb.Bin416]
MITESDLEFVIADQRANFLSKPIGVLRHITMDNFINSSQIVVISGVRRCGKSTLLRQFAQRMGNECVYANFDDERLLHFEVADFSTLLMVWHKQTSCKTVIMDEIQNIPSWQRFVRRIHDEGYKVFISGSNAKLLSGELGTHLSGRYKQLTLTPFSFAEYLDLLALPVQKTTINLAAVSKAFDHYLLNGGFPLYCQTNDHDVLSTLYENILFKDILFRYAIQERRSFRSLAYYALSNIGKEFSYRNITNILGIKSDTSTKNYLAFMEEAYLLFQVPKYDHSLKKQYVSNKKLYSIDNGLSGSVAFRISQDRGRLLENLVYIELFRRGYQLFYHKQQKECDFVCIKQHRIDHLIQVCDDITPENTSREVDGLLEAMNAYNLSKGIILTRGKPQSIALAQTGKHVTVINIIDWLLEKA